MNPEIKAQWIQALRSGTYQQTTDTLRDDQGYCCLGVLCDISPFEWAPIEGTSLYRCEDEEAELPDPVIAWAGLNSPNPVVNRANVWAPFTLAQMNDQGETFLTIADVIERVL